MQFTRAAAHLPVLLLFLSPPDDRQNVPLSSGPNTVSIVSLNLAKERSARTVAAAVEASEQLRNADIFLFQEVVNENGTASVAEEFGRQRNYFTAFRAAEEDVRDQGLAIASRYPIRDLTIRKLKKNDLVFRSRSRFALAVTMDTPAGEMRVWNLHLDTRVNSEDRLTQMSPVLEEASTATGAHVLGGDLNTNSFYWISHMLPLPRTSSQGVPLRKALETRGFRTPLPDSIITLPVARQHLDWVFAKGLDPVGGGTVSVGFSDHRAVWSTFRSAQE